MTWRDHDDDRLPGGTWGRPGGDWAGVRPTIDNPMTWSVPILRVGGVAVRVHLLFLAFVIVQLTRVLVPVQGQHVNFGLTALAMAVLFVIVLVHEFGHVLACRAVHGHADEILMWPLGGLAFCHPPHSWKAHFATAAGGPLVNIAILALAAPMLAATTNQWWGVAIPNPLDPLAYLYDPLIARSWAHIALYMLNALNMLLLAFNLLPLFPLDGGRLLQALLWSRSGWSRSMLYTVRVGFVSGLSLAIFGAVTNNWAVIAVAIFGLLACWNTGRQLAFSDSVLDIESDEYAMSLYAGDREDRQRAGESDAEDDAGPIAPATGAASSPIESSPSPRTTDRAPPAAHEIDRILQKIVEKGIASLTQSEQDLLQRETERKRRESGGVKG